jgi:hypothetical protein
LLEAGALPEADGGYERPSGVRRDASESLFVSGDVWPVSHGVLDWKAMRGDI